jgi:hypothetical protein
MSPTDLTAQHDTAQQDAAQRDTARQTAKAKARSQKKSHPLEIKPPDPEAWKNLVRDLKLNDDQSYWLRITVGDIIAELKSHEKAKSEKLPRPILVERLKLMEKAFSRLQCEMDRSADLMSDFLPFDMLERIGDFLTFTAMGDALGEDVFPKNTPIFVGKMLAKKEQITLRALEDYHSPQRRALGLKNGHTILKHFFESIYAPLKHWVELDRLNKGGRPSNIARRYLIWRLADAAPNIIGKSAPVSTSGKFVALCSQVLPACGLSAKGIEKAVASIVGQKRARHK